MVSLAVAITTAPRPRPTLAASLGSLRRAGFHEPVTVVSDGDPPLALDPLCAHVRSRVPGIVGTWALALERLVALEPDLVLICQDDVVWPPSGWAIAQRAIDALVTSTSAVGYASLYTSPRVARALEVGTVQPVLGPWSPCGRAIQPALYKHRWSGAQAYALPTPAARRLLADPGFAQWRRTATRSIDHEVSDRLCTFGYGLYTWHPSLLSHALGAGNRAPRRGPRL